MKLLEVCHPFQEGWGDESNGYFMLKSKIKTKKHYPETLLGSEGYYSLGIQSCIHSCPSWFTHILRPSQYAPNYLNHHQICTGRNANVFWYLDLGDGQSVINPILKSNQVNVTIPQESQSRELSSNLPCKAQIILYQETTDLI